MYLTEKIITGGEEDRPEHQASVDKREEDDHSDCRRREGTRKKKARRHVCRGTENISDGDEVGDETKGTQADAQPHESHRGGKKRKERSSFLRKKIKPGHLQTPRHGPEKKNPPLNNKKGGEGGKKRSGFRQKKERVWRCRTGGWSKT